MASQVEICNRALSKLGAARITSITDEVKAARAIRAAYDIVRDDVLREHPWNCATARAKLAPLAAAPVHTYSYSYQVPSDCLRVRSVNTPTGFGTEWSVEGRTIVTDSGTSIDIVYTKREEDPSVLDSQFVGVFSTRLAFDICEELTQSNTKKEALWAEYEKLLNRAKRADAQEGSVRYSRPDAWEDARR